MGPVGSAGTKNVAVRNPAERVSCHAAERPVAACFTFAADSTSATKWVSESPERAATWPWIMVCFEKRYSSCQASRRSCGFDTRTSPLSSRTT